MIYGTRRKVGKQAYVGNGSYKGKAAFPMRTRQAAFE